MTKFYYYNQNNSGGSFEHDPIAGLGYRVAIEALSEEEANLKAESIGIYFDGVEKDIDCECCGDRWYSSWEDPSETLKLESGWGIPSYVHYLDGTFQAITKV